ncbi:MAG: RNA-binding transcriptional accessory protein [Saprospiraceae bacterium]|nr:RNA-binding transcriptional accessory protein [Saprospiraceae bacterium]
MIYPRIISGLLNIPQKKVENTIDLLSEGATIPFIARYRKEVTGSLDEVQLAAIQQELKKLQELDKRRETVIHTIEELGKMTPELRNRIENCWDPTELEDIYLPYKPKRKTRATAAREKGLEPLAKIIFEQRIQDAEHQAKPFLTDEVPILEDALQGARDIIAEWISEDEQVRQKVRFAFRKGAQIVSKLVRGKEEEAAKYQDYYAFSEPLKHCPSHRLLAMRRGEDEGFLRLTIEPDNEEVLNRLEHHLLRGNGGSTKQVKQALHDSYDRLLGPSIETEFRNESKEKADLEAINIFVENLRQLLLAAPLGPHRVMGIDPGFRSGCKVVMLNEFGDLMHNTTIYPHPPNSDEYMARKILQDNVEKYHIAAIAIGNGTAGRETMDLCKDIVFAHPVNIFQVSEAGASIYSASEVAREEFPDLDLTIRGAISIGRRLMDPLAELVKLDPKNIGVGQYQHDVNQVKLKESLDRTVESCVNSVGININTASKHLLTYVSGLGPSLAQNIVKFRTENGQFESRQQLKKVARMGDKAFEQSAGFLRIRGAANPLDNSAVHPESYVIVEKMAKDLGVKVPELIADPHLRKKIDLNKYVSEKVGMPTLTDIMKELEKPGLDPRGEAKAFTFANVRSIEDLTIGMVLPGIITNITAFGAFVDIGVKQDGLVHVSQLSNKYVRNPADVVFLSQEVNVRVVEVDLKRRRIQLTMKDLG